MTLKIKHLMTGVIAGMLSVTASASEPAKLAVRMDDMGAFHSVNNAIMDVYRNGISNSVEVMPVAAWYPEAVKMLRDAPNMDIGIHLAITSEWENAKWRPLTKCTTMVDEAGYFLPMLFPNKNYPGQSIKEQGYAIKELEAEFRAQIERVLADLPQTTHLSSHMGSTLVDDDVKALVDRLSKEYNLPCVDNGPGENRGYTYARFTAPDGAYGMMPGKHKTLAEKENSFINMLKNLKGGQYYMFVEHPSYNDSEMQTVFHIGYEDVAADRDGVRQLLTSERVKKAIKDYNVELISVADLFSHLPRKKTTPMAKAIDSYLDAAAANGLDVHSVMVLQHGNVLGEKWQSVGDATTPHIMNSASKTLTSTAAGIAVDDGLLNVNDKVISFFPDKLPAKVSDNLKKMTVRDLLTMTTGQEKANTTAQRQTEQDWVEAFLAEPVPYEPGTYYAYNGLATYMISAIVQKVTGKSCFELLTERVFRPLGISRVSWDMSPQGINCGGWGSYLKTEDMAKIGQLYLQKGNWNGQQLISENWIADATKAQVSSKLGSNTATPEQIAEAPGYGYQIWCNKHNTYNASGALGQYIVVMPDQDAVVALTGNIQNMKKELSLVWDHILPVLNANLQTASK